MPDLNSNQYLPHLVVQPPDVRIADSTDDYLGVRFLSGPKDVLRDEPCDCEMELIYHPNVNYDALREGATFTVREGGKIVGFGTVRQSSDTVCDEDVLR